MSLNSALKDFPGTSAGHATALVLILTFGLIADYRFARGLSFPDGYDAWLIFLATLAGLSTGGMIGKRLSDIGYKAAGTSPVTVEAPSNVTVTQQPAPAPETPGVVITPDADKR